MDSEVNLEEFLEDTLRSCTIQSRVSDAILRQECCMGIDEAGRGPVLGTYVEGITPNKAHLVLTLLRVSTSPGPMVYGTAFCPLSMLKEVKDLGVAGTLFG